MASMFDKVARWARSPQGRRVIDEAARRAQQAARDPATRAKVRQLRGRVQGARPGTARPHDGGPERRP